MSLDLRKQSNGVGVEDFELLSVIGRGGYGKVFMVRYTHSSEIFAMKVRCPLTVLAECVYRPFCLLPPTFLLPPADPAYRIPNCLQVLRKADIVARQQVAHTNAERSIMEKVRHPFVVGLKCAFQTTHKLYMVMDFVQGGDMYTHLSRRGALRSSALRLLS